MKTRSLIVLLLVAAIILTSAWGVFCGVSLGAERFAPMEVLQLGAEVQGETSILLNLLPEEGEAAAQEQITQIMEILQARLEAMGYSHSNIVQLDGDQLEVRVPMNGTSTFHDAQQLSDALRQTGRLYITDAANDDAVLLDRDSIERVELQVDSLGKYSVFMIMTEQGKALLEQITSEVSGREREEDKYVHVFLDEEEVAELSVRQSYGDGYFGYSSSYSEHEAKQFQQIINAGMLPVALEDEAEITVSAGFGEQAWQQILLCGGIAAVILAIVFVVIYRLSGVMHVLTGIAYWVLTVLTVALLGIPVTAANLIGLLIGFGFLLFSMVCISEAFKKQFAAGKNLRAAYKSGFADATVRISNGFALLLFGFVVLIASGAAALENLAYGYGVALVLAYLCAMLISRLLFALSVRVQDSRAGFYFSLKKTSEGGNA